MTSEPEMIFKILILGESCSGKACVLRRFVENKYLKNHLATIGIDFKTKTLIINNQEIKLKIWDTVGQERFNNIATQYYKGTDGIVLVYDVTNKISYEKIRDWADQILSNTQQEEISLVLLGNKCDMEPRTVTEDMGNELAQELKISYFETSALTGQGIKEAFEKLTKDIMKKRREMEKIFKKYFKGDVSYHKYKSLLFQNLKDKKFPFNDTEKSKKDLIKNMEKNIQNLVNHIKELKVKENKEEEVYRSLSCIFGSFFGDDIGAYCKFNKPSKQNIKNIFKGNSNFGDDPGQVTDSSEMAMASAFAIMENIKLELNSNYLYYFYGLWHISKPKDEDNTTRKALKHFDKMDITKLNLNEGSFNGIFKEIEKDNKQSLTNGFLMRTSSIIVYLYFKYKSQITQIFKEKNNQQNLFGLFELIKLEVQKDNICTHPNENLCISHSIFCIMSLGAIYGLDSTQILNNVKTLWSNEFFDEKKEHNIKEIIIKELSIYENNKDFSSFDKAFNYVTNGETNLANHMDYYIHAFRLSLYYLYFFNEINKEKNTLNLE